MYIYFNKPALYINNSHDNLFVPIHRKIISYVSKAFKCTPDGRAGCIHWAKRLLILIRLGITWNFV